MNNYKGLFNVLVVFDETPERILFFQDEMSHTELARAERAHNTYIGADENEDTMWLYSRYFNEMGQQIKEDAGKAPFDVEMSRVIRFGFVL